MAATPAEVLTEMMEMIAEKYGSSAPAEGDADRAELEAIINQALDKME